MMMFVSKVLSLFGTEVRHHVKEMEQHIVSYEETVQRITTERREDRAEEGEAEDLSTRKKDHPREHYEQKRKVTKPISLEELFKPRRLIPGGSESEVRKVLLYGIPGSGKTCISKAIAHKWALGEIMQEFEAIYVVPIRRINMEKSKGPQGLTLKDVVAQICFRERSGVEYKDLLTQVEGDFDSPTTLLMFDGLDEAGEDAKELVHSAEERLCKLLILTRPYNLQGIQTKVDCQFECLGFSDQQLRNYIHRELPQNEASRMVRSLQQDRGMWETAHIPVTAHILCSLSREHGITVEDRGKKASMFRIYNDMTNFVWKRFKEKPEARMAKKGTVFEDLEEIAFEALRKGQILIEERTVESHATSTNTTAIFKRSGFLLLVLEGRQYQFPHLTFQEYFAGRFIARSLKNKGSDEERRVLKFIQEEKYNQKNALTLSFAMHALARKRSKSALHEMLSIVDEDPVEVLGIRHFFLRMRVLEASLEETDEDDLKDVLNDEQAIKLAKGAFHLIKRTIDDVLIRQIVVDELRQSSRVLEHFPHVLNDSINETKKMLKCSYRLTWKAMANITDSLKLAKNSLKHSQGVTEFILQQAKKPSEWCDTKESVKRFELIVKQMPQHAGELLPTLASWCGDKDSNVREMAVDAISDAVAMEPHQAEKILPTLARWCDDENSDVRRCAMEAIGRVVAAAPLYADEYVPTLLRGYGDVDSGVRSDAKEAIVSVVEAAVHVANEVLPTLVNWCSDERWDVRRDTIKAIGRIVAAAPQNAGEYLMKISKWCDDDIWNVRRAAIETIALVVEAAPQHVDQLLLTVKRKRCDKSWHVRKTAMEAIVNIITAAPQYAGEMLSMLTSGCRDRNSDVRREATEAIALVIIAAPKHAGEVLPTLSKWNSDEDLNMCRNATEAIARIVEAVPQHASELLPTLAGRCKNEDSGVRRCAMDAIGRVVVAAPQRASEVLPTLTKWRVDKDRDVRYNGMQTMGRVVAAAPQHASELLPWLVDGCSDDDTDVRRCAMEAMGRVIAVAPHHASELLPWLVDGCSDDDTDVRRCAMEAMGRVIALAPHHASELLPRLVDGCSDLKWVVRRDTIEAIGHIVAAAPQHAGKHLPILVKYCEDGVRNVRRAAIETIGRVIAAAPQHTDKVLLTLARLCDVEDEDVRHAARTTLKDIKPEKAIPRSSSFLSIYKGGLSFLFVQNSFTVDTFPGSEKALLVFHATFSRVIRCWSKDDICTFVGSLMREFDEKYPGLLEHLNAKE